MSSSFCTRVHYMCVHVCIIVPLGTLKTLQYIIILGFNPILSTYLPSRYGRNRFESYKFMCVYTSYYIHYVGTYIPTSTYFQYILLLLLHLLQTTRKGIPYADI
ncbi:hypothetical protein DFH27DRAFT_128831 [Peziza echinospora]|nr:hypothetical protein DFH27DRAFT_128831 [Peziza echinospora]